MSIKSIKIKNLLSFDELIIDNFEDINCIVGKNNAGKSNLLKLLRYFYNKLDEKRELPPLLYSDYSSFGTITIYYDISHIKKIVTADKNISNKKLGYFKEIYNLLILNNDSDTFELTLKIYANESIEWSIKDNKTRKIIADIYPFFDIEARHIDLYDWNKLWVLVSRMKPFNPHKVKQEDVIEFFDEKLNNSDSENYKNYEKYIKIIEDNLETGSYNYSQKVLSFVKSGLKGQSFLIAQEGLETQSDGTNSHKFIETFISLLILLTRKAYITPILYIDEPEVGLHPKRNEELIENIYETYKKVESKTPYPTIILTTHSPNIVKQVIKLFEFNQQILHFSKKEMMKKDEDEKYRYSKYFKIEPTIVKKIYSQYKDKRFLNIFSDNEARLFFSSFILFVEGDTELEIFRNKNFLKNFPVLKEIDVYQSATNVTIENINPSYSNTAIPYILLFDADKIYNFKRPNSDKSKKEIVFKSNGNLYNLKKEMQNKTGLFYNKHTSKIQENINSITKFLQNKYDFDDFTFKLKEQLIYETFSKSLNSYLGNKNIYFVQTTIEETLINEASKELFFKWILKEYSFDKEKLNQKDLDDNILISYIRLFFGGKFLIQVDFSLLEKERDRNKKSKKLFELIKKYQKFPSQKDVKTSGWATKFLDFSINEIEKKLKETDAEKREKEFRDEFKKYFGELYDIITIIEDKLDFDR